MDSPAGHAQPTHANGPVTDASRIGSLDVLRGFAVLGILVMNIQSFSMIGAAYMNPYAYGDMTGANRAVWFLSHLFADMKFMAIFSMLFGAGVVLMAERRTAAGKPSAGLHYRRMLGLLLFGALHGYILWYGDILFTYAVCGVWVYLLRKLRPSRLIIVGLIAVAVSSGVSLFWQATIPWWPPGEMGKLETEWWDPPPDAIAHELEAYRGSWSEQQALRAPEAVFMQTFMLATNTMWRAGGLMLIGMALFKLGVFSADRGVAFYAGLLAVGAFIGLPVVAFGVWFKESSGWDVRSAFFGGDQFNYWASILVALGWIAAVMLVVKSGVLPRLNARLAAVGRMALSCYLLETIICTTIFYGHGLGLYGSVERTGQIAIVFAVWMVLLWFCPWWMRQFRFGPFEWLWRSLTYWKLQPAARRGSPTDPFLDQRLYRDPGATAAELPPVAALPHRCLGHQAHHPPDETIVRRRVLLAPRHRRYHSPLVCRRHRGWVRLHSHCPLLDVSVCRGCRGLEHPLPEGRRPRQGLTLRGGNPVEIFAVIEYRRRFWRCTSEAAAALRG